MKRLNKLVLGLATVTMLASCGAKQITKAEAVEIAKGWDTSIVYKSAHVKVDVSYNFSDNFPAEYKEALKATFDGMKQDADVPADEIESLRLSPDAIESFDEQLFTFKANGKALEFEGKQPASEATGGMEAKISAKTDENGYLLSAITDFSGKMTGESSVEYSVTIKTTQTATYVK